jgi:hypothetical protein
MDDDIKQEFTTLAEQIRKGFAANNRQFTTLKSRIAKMELELASLKRMENRRSEEILELKTRRA